MAEPHIITIAHQMATEEALRRLKPALGNASESFRVLRVDEENWSGDGRPDGFPGEGARSGGFGQYSRRGR